MKSYPAPVRHCGSIARYCSTLNPLLFLAGSLLLANVAFAQEGQAHLAKFQWVTGEPVAYKNWGRGVPSNLSFFYAYLYTPYGVWCDFQNSDPMPGVYESSKVPPKDPTIKWIRWPRNKGGNGNWYGVNTKGIGWMGHKKAAEEMGAHLATISSAKENSFIVSIAKKHRDVWIGLSIPQDGGGGGGGRVEGGGVGGGVGKVDRSGLGAGQQASVTSPTRSAPQQAQGNPTRMNLRIRNW